MRCVRDRMLALCRADGVRGAAIPAAGLERYEADPHVRASIRLTSPIRLGALSTPAEASEDASVS